MLTIKCKQWLAILCLLFAANVYADDFGDAPASYGDISVPIIDSIRIGTTAGSSEVASKYDYRALGDGDEEDGAPKSATGITQFPILISTATSYTTPIFAANWSGNSATLEGWIDFDHSGTFDSTERATVAVPTSTYGNVTLSWSTLPVNMQSGTTFIRLKLSSDVDGAGEVEDHVLSIALPVPPESSSVKVVSGETVRSCQAIVFEDDFDDLTSDTFLAPGRPGFSTIRDWTTTGGGSDTYARVAAISGGGNAIYLGNGSVRRISPSVSSLGGLTFDSDGRLTSVIDAIELRSGPDDITPGSTGTGSATMSSWGPNEVVFSRTFTSTVGTTYRLYFTGIPEGEGSGSYTDGMMRIDTPVGSAHFLAPGSNSGRITYAIEFTATSTSSTIAIANYGHIGRNISGYCNPQHESTADAAWCTVDGAVGKATNEVKVDDIYVVEALCNSDYSDAPANGSTAPDGTSTTNYGETSHDIASGILLGSSIDPDTTTVTSANASGDGSDDDGVTMPPLTQGANATIPVVVKQLTANSGYLQAWVDWNGDGDFLDADEQIATDLQYSGGPSGTINIPVTVPIAAITSETFARFRWSTASGVNSRNSASDGEIEDYALTISPVPAMSNGVINYPNSGNGKYPGSIALLDWAGSSLDDGLQEGDRVSFPLVGCRSGTLTATFSNVSDSAAASYYKPIDMNTWVDSSMWQAYNGSGTGEALYGSHNTDVTFTVDWTMTVDGVTELPDVFVLDAEATDLSTESISATTNGGNWSLVDSAGGTGYVINGIGTQSFTLESSYQPNHAPLLVSMDSTQTVVSIDAGGHEGVAFGVLLPCDYGDAPTSYGDPSHAYWEEPANPDGLQFIAGQLHLGSMPPDSEVTTQTTGDDTDALGDDEDGVTLPTLTQGSSATITATVSGNGGYLQGWIDWDGDGNFNGVGEQVATNLQDDGSGDDANANDGTITFSITPPNNATTNQTYARFRWSTMAGLNATATADDGEVEDYTLSINTALESCEVIPAGEPTAALNSSDVTWNITNGLLNSIEVSGEMYPFDGFIIADSVQYSFTNVGANNQLIINRDGTSTVNITDGNAIFDPAALAAVSDRHLGHYLQLDNGITSTDYFNFIYNDPIKSAGNRYIALTERLGNNTISVQALDANGNLIGTAVTATQGSYISTGYWELKANQEIKVYIYPLTALLASGTDIHGIRYTQSGATGSDGGDGKVFILVDSSQVCDRGAGGSESNDFDLGDAPTDLSSIDAGLTGIYGDASHVIDPAIHLGSLIDKETASQNSGSLADGDDTDGTDDDDGVTFDLLDGVNTLRTDKTNTYLVEASVNGFLNAWIDWNQDGDWDDANEQIATNAPLTAGSNSLTVAVSAAAPHGITYARFRFTSAAVATPSPLGLLSNGEVEDYAVHLLNPPPADICTAVVTNGNMEAGPFPATFTQPQEVMIDGWATIPSNPASGGSFSQRNQIEVWKSGYESVPAFEGNYFIELNSTVAGLLYQDVALTPGSSYPWRIAHRARGGATTLNSMEVLMGPPGAEVSQMTATTGTSWKQYSGTYTVPPGEFITRFSFRSLDAGSIGNFLDDISIPGSCDFGDAPNSYGTTRASNGPYHIANYMLYLGPLMGDSDQDGAPGTEANGDDNVLNDDEDSVSSFGLLTPDDTSYSITVEVTNNTGLPANLAGWLDFDGNGRFDPDEYAHANIPTGSNGALIKLTWHVIPRDIVAGDTYMRTRLSTDTLWRGEMVGSKPDGEVEDHKVVITDTSISGRVFIDTNTNAANDPTEEGISGTVVVLHDIVTGLCRSVKTGGDGYYQFIGLKPSSYKVYQAHGETVPSPQNCGATFAFNPPSYQSTTPDVLTVTLAVNDVVTEQSFGEVPKNTFSPDHQSSIAPGTTTTYAHVFSPTADGTVRFTTTESLSITNGWTTNLYRDADCNGLINGSDALNVVTNTTLTVQAGVKICLINKVFVPSSAQAREQYLVGIAANFTYANGSAAPEVLKVKDLTTTTGSSSSGAGVLKLVKYVQNVTQGTASTQTINAAIPGDLLRYRIQYRNVGTGPITEINVNDSVPPFTNFVAGSANCDSTPAGLSCLPITLYENIEWAITGSLAAGEFGQVSYQVTVDTN